MIIHSDEYQRTLQSSDDKLLIQVMAWCCQNIPLPGTMLTHIYVIIWRHQATMSQICIGVAYYWYQIGAKAIA